MSATPGQGLALPVTDPDLEARLHSRMDEVEKALYAHVQSRFPFVTEAASHLLDAGGKRFRPLLVLLAAEAGAHPSVDDVVTAACVVEITHVGSLYHDDVMDEADLRRGEESANARWDNLVAILTGDFLFAKSSELTALLGADAVRIQAETFTRLVEGQILETVEPGPGEDPLAHYLEVVAGKTGSLIATSARYGARFGGATPEVEEALAAYGEIVGSAFQLSDDIIDIASDSVESGKTPGTDLREGVPTLPVLMAQASTSPDGRPAARAAGRATDRRRPARRGPRAAPGPPRHGPGPRLRRRPRHRGQGAPGRAPGRSGPRGARGVRRRGGHPLVVAVVTHATVVGNGRNRVQFKPATSGVITVRWSGGGTFADLAASDAVSVSSKIVSRLRGGTGKSGRTHLVPASRTAVLVAALLPNHKGDCLRFHAQYFVGGRSRLGRHHDRALGTTFLMTS